MTHKSSMVCNYSDAHRHHTYTQSRCSFVAKTMQNHDNSVTLHVCPVRCLRRSVRPPVTSTLDISPSIPPNTTLYYLHRTSSSICYNTTCHSPNSSSPYHFLSYPTSSIALPVPLSTRPVFSFHSLPLPLFYISIVVVEKYVVCFCSLHS